MINFLYRRNGWSMWKLTVSLIACALLTGCDTQLLVSLSEHDSNEVLVTLLRAGIDAHKDTADVGKTWEIVVPQSSVVQSLDLLQVAGLPRMRYANLGDMFKKDGLVSTPVEERVRFVYGVSQELADTLQRMDGVIAARVHIVMPQNDPFATTPKPASASVFIKHRFGMASGIYLAPIKNLVAHSVEGLTYDAVSVVFVEAEPLPIIAQARPLDLVVFLECLFSGIAILAAGTWLVWRHRIWLIHQLERRRKLPAAAVTTTPPPPPPPPTSTSTSTSTSTTSEINS